MPTAKTGDAFLDERLSRYDRWLKKGQITFSAKVIPVAASLTAYQQVLPTEQGLELLDRAATVAVQPCECRTHYRRCDNPLDVCFLLNAVADKLVAAGRARHVDLAEAATILDIANRHGLVHLCLYRPDHEIFALCSCCPCCCHDLQIVRHYDRKDLMVRSAYTAVTDTAVCATCGQCVERCPFDARVINEGVMTCHADDCLGCGLCVTVCPSAAIRLTLRE